MTTTPNRPQVYRYANTELMNWGHHHEFIDVIDSLGRRWNPLLHPRDSEGKFIRTFSFVSFDLPGGGTASGRVSGIDQDGSLLVKVQGTTPGAPEGIEGSYIKVPHDKVTVQTVKAQLTGKGTHVGVLRKQENKGVDTSIKNLRAEGMDAQADKLAEAQQLAMEAPDPRDPQSVANKERAIQLFREVAEEVDLERGKGFKEGDDYEAIKAQLPSSEKGRLQRLDAVTKNTYTARHSLGDKTISDIETSQGQMQGNQPETRIEAAENELVKDFAEDVKVWDMTSGTLVEGQLEAPVKAEVRDTVAEQQGTEGLPELWRSAYQKLRSGKDRLAGYKQAMQVAPGDRHHVDKTGVNVVRVGMIAHFDKTKSRGEFTGMVTRLYTDADGKKHIYGRDFDPDGEKGYQATYGTPYRDWQVSGSRMELASEEQQSTLFQKLALEGQDEASKSLVQSFTEEYIAAMQRRYATPGALKISGVAPGFFDVVPIHLREKKDGNGEKLRIGDAVMGPNGEDGFVSYMEPNSATTKVYWHNGESARLSANKLKRHHGATSEVYPDDSAPGTNNYVPTREEAAAVAEEKGAASVAQVIRDGGDARAIQAAMVTDVAFQGFLDGVDELYQKRDRTRAAGQDLSEEDRAELDKMDRMFMASAGYFREPADPPPTPPEAPDPDPEMEGEAPQNPDNPTEKVTPEGVVVREEDDQVIVNDNTEDPIDAGDQQAIEQAVEDAAGEQAPEETEAPEQPEEAAPSLASKLQNDIGRLVEEAKQAPQIDNNQRAQLDQMMNRLNDAITNEDGPGVVRGLQGLTTVVNRQVNANLGNTRLAAVLRGRATGGTPMADFIQQKLDAGENIFGAPEPVVRQERPAERPDESPEGVDPKVDAVDTAVSEALLMDDGTTMVMRGDEQVDEGFYVVDPATITEYDAEPTTQDITEFLDETDGSSYDGISIWYDEADGRYRMARVGVFEDEQDAADSARTTDTNQYVNIADGAVMNVATDGDQNSPAEAVEDPRSEERAVRVAGTGRAGARSTAKQKKMLDHVAGIEGADPEIGRITEAVKGGEEITGADASRLADYVDGLGADQFEKPSDKGVASQLAHRLARAAGEEGARGYSSQNTALRRTSDVGNLLSGLSRSDEVRNLVDAARDAIKKGDFDVGAVRFRQAADVYDDLDLPNDMPSRRAREHADRLDAMGGVTAPAPEQGAAPTAQQALDNAGVGEAVPITQESLTNSETERTRPVDPVRFAALAVQGKNSLDQRWSNASEPAVTQGEVFGTLKGNAWDAVQEEWGGITVDAHEAQIVSPTEGFAMTVRPPGMESVSVPIGGSQEEFDAAMDEAATRFGGPDGPLAMEGAHLGVFRNEDTGNVEIDPVLVVDTLEDVEAIGAYTGAVGGAYNFADGLGYWPPYVTEGGEGGGAGEAEPGAVARPGEGEGEAPPGVGEAEGEAPAGGGPEAPEVVTQVRDALGTADSAIDDERQGETENGPQGWTDDLDEANAQLGLIRGRITSEGPYTELSRDLRELADFMEGSWRVTDPSTAVDELRAAADALDGAPGAPEGETPGGEGGGAPFRLGDHATLHAALTDEDTRAELHRITDDYLQAQLSKYKTLLDQVDQGSLANVEVNNAKFAMLRQVNRVNDLLANVERRGDLSADDVANILSYSGGEAAEQNAVDIWNGTGQDHFPTDSIEEFMGHRLQQTAEGTQAEVDEATADRPVDLQYIDTRFRTDSELAARRTENYRIGTLEEYQQAVGEIGSILATINTLRVPENRLNLRKDQVAHLRYIANRLDVDAQQARIFLDELDQRGLDSAPLRGVLDGVLGKYDAADLLVASPDIPIETRNKLNDLHLDYRRARDRGDPGAAEAAAAMEVLVEVARSTNNAREHGYLAGAMRGVLLDQIGANNGTIPEPFKKLLRDPVLERFGVFQDMITRADMEDIAATDPDDLSTATGGRYDTVEWGADTTVSPDLVTDDRPSENGEIDAAWNYEIEQVTPNAAAALNAMWTRMGGGIHRTNNHIAEASTEDAEIWRKQGWNRGDTGEDTRGPDQVQGVYTKNSNNVIVADSVLGRRRNSVVVHELGHALDSMLGDLHSENRWFTQIDPEFKAFHAKLKETAAFSDDPNDSIMYWYFRDKDEGGRLHNGGQGTQEVWAEGYAAYAWAKQMMSEEDFPHQLPANKELIYTQVGRSLVMDTSGFAVQHGKLTPAEAKKIETDMGHLIFDFFEDLETRRLPEIMKSGPHVIPKNSALRTISQGFELSAPPTQRLQRVATAEQKTKADTHNSRQHGVIQMTPVERGSPEWDAMEAAVKAVSPGASMPPPSAIYTTWNPAFAEQGASVIWKSVMPGEPKYTMEYTDEHKATRLAAKFQREQRVNQALDTAHRKAEAEAAFDETAALVLAMIETGMRVGSSARAGSVSKTTGKKVPTFGGATMQAKHVFFPSETLMRFKFPGKAGTPNVYESRNPVLRAAVQQLLAGKKPSDQLFAGTNSGRTIDYLREATGIEDIINHDTRTRFATNMARQLVAKWPKSRMPKNEAALKKAKTEISKKVGAAINDGWQVARDSYISNAVWQPMEDSAGVPHSFDDSPPYGLIEGEVVQSIGGPAVSGTPAAEGAPPAPVAAAAEAPPTDVEPESWTLDQSPEAVAEREAWYRSFVWPDPPIVAGPDPTFSAEDGDDEPAQTEETNEVE